MLRIFSELLPMIQSGFMSIYGGLVPLGFTHSKFLLQHDILFSETQAAKCFRISTNVTISLPHMTQECNM